MLGLLTIRARRANPLGVEERKLTELAQDNHAECLLVASGLDLLLSAPPTLKITPPNLVPAKSTLFLATPPREVATTSLNLALVRLGPAQPTAGPATPPSGAT